MCWSIQKRLSKSIGNPIKTPQPEDTSMGRPNRSACIAEDISSAMDTKACAVHRLLPFKFDQSINARPRDTLTIVHGLAQVLPGQQQQFGHESVAPHSSVGRHPALLDQEIYNLPPENMNCSIRSGLTA